MRKNLILFNETGALSVKDVVLDELYEATENVTLLQEKGPILVFQLMGL